jgi:hypothetical protein
VGLINVGAIVDAVDEDRGVSGFLLTELLGEEFLVCFFG